jgi:hypothetical protein
MANAVDKIRALFKLSSQLIIKLANENKQLKARIAYLEKKAKAEEIVDKLIRAGHISEFQKEAKVKEIMQSDLNAWEKAASLLSSFHGSLGEVISPNPSSSNVDSDIAKILMSE